MSRHLLVLGLLVSCAPTGPELAPVSSHSDSDIELLRVGSGDFIAGETVTFEARVPPGVAEELHWEVSAGTLSTSEGARVQWTLPQTPGKPKITVSQGDRSTASVRVGARNGRAYISAQQGEVVSNTLGEMADTCRLEFEGNTPHMLYRNATHGRLYLGVWSGSAWSETFVDGPGFDVGGTISERYDMVLDSSGNHHIAYAYEDDQYLGYAWKVYWASDQGGSWTREQINNDDSFDNAWPSIALDPLNSERPTVVWTQEYSYDSTAVAYRTGVNTWSHSRYGENGYSQHHTGGAVFDNNGVLHVTKGLSSYGHVSWTPSTTTWSSNRWVGYSGDGTGRWRAAMANDDDGHPLYMHPEGLGHYINGTSWSHSEVELFEMDWFDVAWGGGKPHMAVIHDGNLELITTDADGYWEYTVIATGVDDATPGIGVDADGDPHVCYRKAGALYYY